MEHEFEPSDEKSGSHLESFSLNVLKSGLDDSAVPFELQQKIVAMARPAGWAGEGSGEISQEACWATMEFLLQAKQVISSLDNPRIGPSPMGAVALQWDFDDVSFVVRISSGSFSQVHFQQEGPDFEQEEGVTSREEILARLGKIAANHVLS